MFLVRAAMALFFLRPSVAYIVNPTRRHISLPSQVSHRYQKTPDRALNAVSQEYITLSSRSYTRLNAAFDTANDDIEDVQKPISASFAMDPKSDEARIVTSSLGISDASHLKLVDMARLVVEWNERLNLVSRKDCSPEVVFGRHILPSVALAALPGAKFGVLNEDGVVNEGYQRKKIVDVGTGGGFPGLPLAIIFPQSDFLLVDSVGKKLSAVSAMVEELGLTNVQTHHGRAEEMVDDILEGPRHMGAYDVCVGRSVTALPRFCFWVSDLLRKGIKEEEDQEGKLVYIIGGEIQESVQSKAQLDTPIDELLHITDASDKRALVFTAQDVAIIAAESGEVKQVRGIPKAKGNVKRKKDKPKGNWEKRDNSVAKQRGYDNFKRFEQN